LRGEGLCQLTALQELVASGEDDWAAGGVVDCWAWVGCLLFNTGFALLSCRMQAGLPPCITHKLLTCPKPRLAGWSCGTCVDCCAVSSCYS
jgi:hypothetical protein